MRILASYCLTALVGIAMVSQMASGLLMAFEAIGAVSKSLLQALG